jgi:hypothetical protein
LTQIFFQYREVPAQIPEEDPLFAFDFVSVSVNVANENTAQFQVRQ